MRTEQREGDLHTRIVALYAKCYVLNSCFEAREGELTAHPEEKDMVQQMYVHM